MPLGDPCQKQACDIQRCLQGKWLLSLEWRPLQRRSVRPNAIVSMLSAAIQITNSVKHFLLDAYHNDLWFNICQGLGVIANHYKEALCTEAFRAMDKCCEKWAEKSGCCAGFLKDQQLKKKTAKSTTSL
ncbi:uncharacterized protein LOC111249071 [Varroa destructor]|uniref:Uncharacterized protein n=1 Tax=Varroa destructor TaxID=109461 RepID=A0A7M7K5Y3_VARDE|nr:uncharacterized protein LOC111249071 [Varroa destructor]